MNADGDFGSPQFINWNWPPVNASGAFDIPAGWAEDERNWAVLTAAQNRVETAAAILGAVDPAKVVAPSSGANDAERAWHYLLAGYESGYMYYGQSLDMEVKATLACNKAVAAADPVIAGDIIVYSLVVSNAGPSDAENVSISDPVPANTTFIDASPGCSESH